MPENKNLSLHQEYLRALQLSRDYTETYSQPVLSRAIAGFESLRNSLRAVHYFSANEHVDDLSASGLDLLTTSFQIAHLLMNVETRVDSRREILLRTQALHDEFLSYCLSYGVVAAASLKTVEARFSANENDFSNTMPVSREARIERYRYERELENDILKLSNSADEDAIRRAGIYTVQLCVSKSLQDIESSSRELEMLRNRERAQASDSRENPNLRGDEDASLWRLDDVGPVLNDSGKVLRPFVITSTREQFGRNVFKPDHSLPTMSIDEYLEIERKRGGILARASDAKPSTISATKEEKEENDRLAAISWDEYKETHAKGIGNTMNRG